MPKGGAPIGTEGGSQQILAHKRVGHGRNSPRKAHREMWREF